MLTHIKGSCELLRLRGPKAYTSPTSRAMLQDVRWNMMSMDEPADTEAKVITTTNHCPALCMAQRRRDVLSIRGWLAVPWESATKSTRDVLYDKMSAIPALLGRVDRLMLVEPSQRADAGFRKLLVMLESALGDLAVWRQSANLNGTSTVHMLSRIESSKRKRTLAECEAAELAALSSALQLILHRELHHVHLRLRERSDDYHAPAEGSQLDSTTPTEVSRYLAMAASDSDEITRCLGFCLDSKVGYLGAMRAIFPIMVASSFLHWRGDPKLDHLRKLTEEYQQRSRWPIVGLMEDISSSGYHGDVRY